MFTVRVNAPLWCRTCVIFHVLGLLTIFTIVFKQIVWYCWLRKPVRCLVSVFILPSILQWIEILTSLCGVCITPDEALVSRDAYTHLAACYDYILHYLTIIPLQFNELSHCILRYNVVTYKTTSCLVNQLIRIAADNAGELQTIETRKITENAYTHK